MKKGIFLCVLSILFIGAFSIPNGYAKANDQRISLTIDGVDYNESADLSFSAYMTAQKYGGIKEYALSMYAKGVDKRRIFDYLCPMLGTRFFDVLEAKEIPPINAEIKVLTEYPYFSYISGKEGMTYADKDAIVALAGAMDGEKPTLDKKPTPPDITVKDLVERTRLIASFTTDVSSSSDNRRSNVKLALSSINGTILDENESFSFNEKVGKRTSERGYKTAKVITDGKYVEGIGGGVCQAATTLYNTVLRAGAKVEKVSKHTYSPSYVSPSLDAMVSDFSDLVFRNVSPYPIYIFTECTQTKATVRIYGRPDKKIEVLSETIEEIPYKTIDERGAEIENFDGYEKISGGSVGIRSKAFLVVDGVKTKIREDYYPPINEIFSKIKQ